MGKKAKRIAELEAENRVLYSTNAKLQQRIDEILEFWRVYQTEAMKPRYRWPLDKGGEGDGR